MTPEQLDAIQKRADRVADVRAVFYVTQNSVSDSQNDVPALLAYARDLEARIGRVDEVVCSMDQRVKQNVRNIESGLYDETFTAVAHGVNSFAESSAIRIRAALTATEARA